VSLFGVIISAVTLALYPPPLCSADTLPIMADPDPGYSAGEKIAGILGAVLFAALTVIALDLATGGRLLAWLGGKPGCGCPDKDEGTAGDAGD
jgi:hypothetical protein